MQTSLVEQEVTPLVIDHKISTRYNHSAMACLLPFQQESPDDLQAELWAGVRGGPKRGTRAMKWPLTGFRYRGNYVKAYVLSNLRIHAKSVRPRLSCHLDGLWDRFPTELICSIYSLLHPIDLYHAICTTKRLRRFLLDKNSSFIWKDSFLNHPDIPFYPDDVSAPKWASLIFGPATCDSCGLANCLVEYGTQCRKCENCKDLYRKGDLSKTIRHIIGDFSDQRDDIWKIATKVYRDCSFTYWVPGLDDYFVYYSAKEIVKLAENMRQYLLKIRSGTVNSRSNYEEYMNATKAATLKRDEHVKMCYRWAQAIQKRSYKPFLKSLRAFCKMATILLSKRCYNERDIENAVTLFNQRLCRESEEGWGAVSDIFLSKSKLSKYLPRLELLVGMFRTARIREERKYTISPRLKEIDSHFNHATKILLTHRAKRQYIHPHVNDAAVYKVKFFSEYIDNPDHPFVPLDYNAAQPEIRRFLEAQLAVKKHSLFIILLDKGLLPQGVNRESDPDQYLDLAIAVFRCPSCFQPCVGWEEAIGHLHGKRDTWCAEERFEFCESGYQALRSMVDGLRLGSESLATLTHTDLDILNRRFVCKTCWLRKGGSTCSLPSLTWRECLRHAEGATLHVPEFDVLTSALTPHLLACEDPFPPPSQAVWGCLHCVSYGEPLTKARAIHHNCEIHNIANPVENVDFSFIHTPKFPKRSQFFIGLDENANQRCLKCPLGIYKLWIKKDGDLFRHLWDAHGIKSTDLIEGVDWERLEVVEDDSWMFEAINDD